MEGTSPSPEFSLWVMIDVVSVDKFTAYLELLLRRPVNSLEKRWTGFSGMSVEFIHHDDTIDYIMKLMLYRTLTRKSSFPHERGRSIRPEVFCKKGVLKNFAKFTRKHQCQGLFFNKVAGLKPMILLKKCLYNRFFRVNFAMLILRHF